MSIFDATYKRSNLPFTRDTTLARSRGELVEVAADPQYFGPQLIQI